MHYLCDFSTSWKEDRERLLHSLWEHFALEPRWTTVCRFVAKDRLCACIVATNTREGSHWCSYARKTARSAKIRNEAKIRVKQISQFVLVFRTQLNLLKRPLPMLLLLLTRVRISLSHLNIHSHRVCFFLKEHTILGQEQLAEFHSHFSFKFITALYVMTSQSSRFA